MLVEHEKVSMLIIGIEFEIYKAFKIIKKSLLIGKSKRTTIKSSKRVLSSIMIFRAGL